MRSSSGTIFITRSKPVRSNSAASALVNTYRSAKSVGRVSGVSVPLVQTPCRLGGPSFVCADNPAVPNDTSATAITQDRNAIRAPLRCYGNSGGGIRFFVACSNEYASSMSFGSLHAIPLKLTPYGSGFASNPDGKGALLGPPAGAPPRPAAVPGALGTNPNGTITVG